MRKMVIAYSGNLFDNVRELFYNDYDSEEYSLCYTTTPFRWNWTSKKLVSCNEYFKEKGIRAKYVKRVVFVPNEGGTSTPYVDDVFVFFDMMDYLRFV